MNPGLIWVDESSAADAIESRVAAGEITVEEAANLRKFAEDGYCIFSIDFSAADATPAFDTTMSMPPYSRAANANARATSVSSVTSPIGPGVPALLYAMSSRPNAATVRCTIPAAWLSSATSQFTAIARWPAAFSVSTQ